ncbi:MAG: class I SAM-dependent methyltransferase [Polyangiaceae bacterium]|nr:class I SAM-dependent methyltransferase [Polyangiaceae bacterium]
MRSYLLPFPFLLLASCSSPSPPHPHPPGHEPHAHHHASGGGHQPGYHGHRFDDPEHWFKRFEGPERDAWQLPERVLSFVELKPGQSLADVGAGTGYFAVRFARQNPSGKVFAVDIEPSMVKFLGERAQREQLGNMKAVLAPLDGVNLPEPVDVLFVCDTYHHIDNRTAYFKKAVASLKPGGQLVLVDFKKDAPEGPPPEARIAPEQIDQELGPAGLVRVRSDLTTLPRQYMLAYQVSPAAPTR